MSQHPSDRHRVCRSLVWVAFSFAAAIAPGPARAGFDAVAPTLFAYDYSNERLVCFAADAPSLLTCNVPLSGLLDTEFLLGIDFRPATGELYAIGSSPPGDRVVTIDTASGAVTAVTQGLLDAIPGGYFGVAFNPIADRIRVVSNLDTNLRMNPTTGVVAATDPSLAYAAGDPNQGADAQVVHVAYTNSFPGAASTTVFAIDIGLDILVRIGSTGGTPVSPNTSQLTTIGPLGVDATASGGFDIDPATGAGWAALRVGGVSRLYSIDLGTGAATLVGSIGAGDDFDGLAVPEPGASGAAVATVFALLGLRRSRA